VAGVECELVRSFAFDEAGRAQIDALPDSAHVIEADTVIFAVGQRPELELCGDAVLSPRRTLAVDSDTFMTSRPGVFAAGDAITGTGAAIDAIAAGHRAACGIHQYLRGNSQIERPVDAWQGLFERPMPVVRKTPADVAHLARQARRNPEHRLFDAAQPFAEAEDPFSEEAALAEASRCLTCGRCAECLQCVSACEARAIDHSQQGWDEELSVGAVIVATGFDMFRPEHKPNLGYGKYPNVMHALELERTLSASGPTTGTVRLKDGTAPHDVVFIQCVGSRDIQEGNPYCSRVCCMYTAKEAHLIRDRLPDANITVFYIDIRAFGKHFEEFHERVRHERIIYRRGNVSEVVKGRNGKLVVRAEDTLLGEPIEVEADLVVLATGLVPRQDAPELAQMLGVPLGSDGFLQELHAKMSPVATERPGIFLAGACQGPKDILDTVSHARAAAASALVLMAQAEAQPVAAD
jgi:heterodisulfide reductase subunit A